MKEESPDLGTISRRDEFLKQATDRLGSHPSDFQEALRRISDSGKTNTPHMAAGVLLPLLFRDTPRSGQHQEDQFIFRLIKRSALVPQPGDLSCPGGMLHPLLDRFLRPFLIHGPFPLLSGGAGDYAARRGQVVSRIITLFLTNAVREAWEEIGLSPSRIRFLGPLPTYDLKRFRRTIFPLVGYVTQPWAPTPNREVERIVEIPLAAFYRAEQFGCLTLSAADPSNPSGRISIQHPCLIHRDPDGGEEILWGATFKIIVQFLSIVMDYRLPSWQDGRLIERTLRSDYLTGRT
jgi:8-oxo-dGTP pyrophosphatase MutT (NUDIX family)